MHKHVAEEFELLPDTTKLLHKCVTPVPVRTRRIRCHWLLYDFRKLLDADGVRECVSQGSVMALMGTRRATGVSRILARCR